MDPSKYRMCSIQSTILTQGRLHCTQLCFHRIAGLIPASNTLKIRATRSGLHGSWVIARMPLRIALLPYLPAQAPNWASAASTRSFIDMPFDGFLAPPSKVVMLTRILHHRGVIITQNYILCKESVTFSTYLYFTRQTTCFNVIINFV